MYRIIALALALFVSACSSGSTSGTSVGELRSACKDGKGSACRAVRQHDALL